METQTTEDRLLVAPSLCIHHSSCRPGQQDYSGVPKLTAHVRWGHFWGEGFWVSGFKPSGSGEQERCLGCLISVMVSPSGKVSGWPGRYHHRGQTDMMSFNFLSQTTGSDLVVSWNVDFSLLATIKMFFFSLMRKNIYKCWNKCHFKTNKFEYFTWKSQNRTSLFFQIFVFICFQWNSSNRFILAKLGFVQK